MLEFKNIIAEIKNAFDRLISEWAQQRKGPLSLRI